MSNFPTTAIDTFSSHELDELRRLRYGDPSTQGWGPRLRAAYGVVLPDERFDLLIEKLIQPGTRWLDAGCGRAVFPQSPNLASRLATQAALFVGIDPDETILENPYVHQAIRTSIDRYASDDRFDVISLRMVAEHVEDPAATLAALSRVLAPGGVIVIYTVNNLSLVTLASCLIPFRLHHAIKHFLWKTKEKDTFPAFYRMNSRRALARQAAEAGLREVGFEVLSDCRTFHRFRLLHRLELFLCRCLHSIGLKYPETCLLGLYGHSGAPDAVVSAAPSAEPAASHATLP